MIAGTEAELEDVNEFGLENFTYMNRIIAETMFQHLEVTNFTGLTVCCVLHSLVVYDLSPKSNQPISLA